MERCSTEWNSWFGLPNLLWARPSHHVTQWNILPSSLLTVCLNVVKSHQGFSSSTSLNLIDSSILLWICFFLWATGVSTESLCSLSSVGPTSPGSSVMTTTRAVNPKSLQMLSCCRVVNLAKKLRGEQKKGGNVTTSFSQDTNQKLIWKGGVVSKADGGLKIPTG